MRSPVFALIAAGLIVGVCVGIVGTGGAFIVPVLIYVFRMSQLKAQGTALLIAACPVCFFPFIPYWRDGQYDLKTTLLLALGVAPGGYFGGVLAQNLPEEFVRKAFALVLMGLALKMFLE